jgi:5'(3')-deoxyribonucleotidase
VADRFVFGVDLDGVVADFYGGLRPIAAEWLGVPVESLTREPSYGLPEWGLTQDTYEDLHRFAVTQRSLFLNLEPLEGAPAALRRLSQKDVRIRIITHRLYIKWFHADAVRQTTEWLERYGVPYWDLCFMQEKDAVGADLYIEDAPGNVERLRRADHETIVFTNSTNRGVGNPRANNWVEAEELALQAQVKWKEKKS